MPDQLATVGDHIDTPAKTAEPSSLVALAIEQKVPVELLERLVALQERVTQQAAEAGMARALAAFQEECPPIRRTDKATVTKNGVKQYEYKFAPLDEVVRTIRQLLAKNGLSFTHDSALVNNEVVVTCTLHHVEGAKRSAEFRGPIDTSGGKNPIQQVASARSYGRRYSLIDVLGLVTEEDDDGRAAGAAGGEPINEGQAADLRALIRETKADEKRFLDYLQVDSVDKIPASKYAEAVAALEQKRRRA